MIKTPEIPTDNLYKFMAIFGLVLTIFGIYQGYDGQEKFYQRIEKYSSDGSLHLYEKSKNDSKTFLLSDKITFKKTKIKALYNIENANSITTDAYQKIKDKIGFEKDFFDLKQLEYDKNLMSDTLNFKEMREKYADDLATPQLFPIFLILALGIFLMFAGFGLWYIKTQKFQDRAIAAQL